MDREALSRWMTACISSPLPSAATADAAYFSESRGGRKGILGGNAAPVVVVVNAAASAKAATATTAATANVIHIGPYDQSVSAVLSRYSMTFGSGRLTSSEFRDLYVEATWAGYVNDVVRRRISPNDDDDDCDEDDEEEGGGRRRRRVRRYRIPSAESGIVFADRKNTERMILAGASLSIVWRDLEAHGVFSPAEEERVRALLEMERRLRPANASAGGGEDDRDGRSGRSGRTTPPPPPLMDECELYDEYEESLSRRFSSGGGGLADDGDYVDDDVMGAESAWDFLGRRKKGGKGGGGGGGINREKGSHELVEMASDGRTPKRIRDGQFVFIDEETCIGCVQCAQIAPSSFKMIEDSGRARTYQQSSALDVENAVMACPVNCMHFMSFDELKEMEVSRDDGDGRSDHRHFGGGRAHTPLHVSKDSDAGHKSSWYHYLKTKCHGSASCPQRGCYDCPTYAPGENPFFKERHRLAELVRAREFMTTGEADKWRTVVEL